MVGDAPHATREVVGGAEDKGARRVEIERVHSLITADERSTRFEVVSWEKNRKSFSLPLVTEFASCLTFSHIPQLHLSIWTTCCNDSVHRRPTNSVDFTIVCVEVQVNLVWNLITEINVADSRQRSVEQIVAFADWHGTSGTSDARLASRFCQFSLHCVVLLSGKNWSKSVAVRTSVWVSQSQDYRG